MSFEEKNTWVFGVTAVAVAGAYFVLVLTQLASTDVTKIDYVGPMLTAIGVAVALGIVGSIVISTASRRDAGRKDERDARINRYGDKVGYHVLGGMAAVPLVLAMARVDYFWIANALYLAFVLAAVTSSIVKIVGYRRGI